MDVTVKQPWLKAAVTLSFLVMLTVNALANALPINGMQTGAVSDLYPNLFTPAPYTFAIWGAIYLMLLVYVVFQLLPAKGDGGPERQKMLREVALLFTGTSLLNAGWIFAWHYRILGLTVVLMVLLLLGLMRIGWLLREPHCDPREELALRIPFGLYFGWITVATVANVSALLKSMDWNGFGLSEDVWMAAILVVAAAIATVTMYRIRSVAYGLVAVWAFIGILIRHTSSQWYAGSHTLVVGMTIALIAALAASVVVTAVHMRRVAACNLPGKQG